MSYQLKLKKMGATPGKLALVAVLAVVLVLVITKQLPKSAPDNAGVARATQKQSKAKKAGSKVEPKVSTTKFYREAKELPSWPEVDFTETLASNPFALPSWAVREEPAATATQAYASGELVGLKELGATIIVIGKENKTATIGEEKYHIGDTLKGYQVTDITTLGIVLHKLAPHE